MSNKEVCAGYIAAVIREGNEDEGVTPLAIAQAMVKRRKERSCTPVIDRTERGYREVVVRPDHSALLVVAMQFADDVGTGGPFYRLGPQQIPRTALGGEKGLDTVSTLLITLRRLGEAS